MEIIYCCNGGNVFYERGQLALITPDFRAKSKLSVIRGPITKFYHGVESRTLPCMQEKSGSK
ncbi:hypothetical protein DERF_007908 [Dermatophagoides farinae]|uniref:Uncharacterized protein n=1 Tax=Dermatophagoides farinae TaxID=6954 RepID=A0A922L4Y8_DERFA|nr:hypothetical protein DERF_007908 [Dermatophagoides farinae]